MTALALEHMGLGFGYLLLLGFRQDEAADETRAFLKTVQVILSEEVAAAQMLDRMRELSIFNTRILETVRSGIWVIDESARTIYSNRIAQEMLSGRRVAARTGTPDLEVGRGRSALDPRHGISARRVRGVDDLPELFLDGMLKVDHVGALPFVALSSREHGFQGEGYVQRTDEAVPVLVTTSQMAGRGEGERWLVVVLEDLQETKKLAAEKQRADGLQSLVEMSATLAHEIRNPLMGLSAQAELLSDQLEEADPRRRYIDVITGEVETINETITRMLQYVRPCELRRAETDLGRIIDDCVALSRPRRRQVRGLRRGVRPRALWHCEPGLDQQWCSICCSRRRRVSRRRVVSVSCDPAARWKWRIPRRVRVSGAAACVCASSTGAGASAPRTRRPSSAPSSPPRVPERASACPSAVRSSRPTGATSSPNGSARRPCSPSCCLRNAHGRRRNERNKHERTDSDRR